jgi:two-component system response regulator HydG
MPELVFFRRGQQLLKLNIERGRMVLGRGALCHIALPHVMTCSRWG